MSNFNDIKYSITPEQLLSEKGYKFSIKGNWLSVKYCPFCDGGRTRQQYTFGVHRTDYNYNCLRTTCGNASSFWNLLKHFGYDPYMYMVKNSAEKQYSPRQDKSKNKRFVYKRK